MAQTARTSPRQPPKPDTRERLLEVAEAAVLAKGFSATSIEELIAAVGITKGGFFYHFKDKNELARALMLRYLEHDRQVLDDIFTRGDATDADPLKGFLAGLTLFAEALAQLKEAHRGCLVASFTYQDQLFDREIRALNADGILAWRRRFRARFDLIAAGHPPRGPADFDALADMAATLVEGGLILGRALSDAAILPKQILLYRDFVQAIFR
jgi:AcrR family transcriptional regulator